jgi:hypothetical protein
MQNWEALRAVKEGKKVTNKQLVPNSYIYFLDGKLYTGFTNSSMKIVAFGTEFTAHDDEWEVIETEHVQ